MGKLVLVLLFLFSTCLAQQPSQQPAVAQMQPIPVPPSNTLPTNKAPTPQNKNEGNNQFSGTIYVFLNGDDNSKLDKYDVNKLNQKQQQIDKFIRGATKVGNSPLTDARGSGNSYVYTYEDKNGKTSKVWVITVRQREPKKDDQKKDEKSKSSSSQEKKYVVTGINYIQSGAMSEQDKEKFDQRMKNFEKSMDKFMEDMDTQLKNTQLLSWL